MDFMPTFSAIWASSGEYTPPVNRYGSERSRARDCLPGVRMGVMVSSTRVGLAQLERARGPHGTGIQQRGGAAGAVGGGLQRDRAAGAQRGAAILAREAVKQSTQGRSASTMARHGLHPP